MLSSSKKLIFTFLFLINALALSNVSAEVACKQSPEIVSVLNKIQSVKNTEPRVALVIGNSAYKPPDDLLNAANDAEDIAIVLEKLGFQVICALDVNRTEFMHKLKQFRNQLDAMGKTAVSLFYYAGHGVQVNNNNYIIPLAATLNNPGDFETQAVNMDLVMGNLSVAANKHGSNLIILDACRESAPGSGWAKPKAEFSIKGMYWAFGTGYGKLAADGTGRNGLFTKHILENIHNEGLTFEQLMKKVTAAVHHESDGVQIPEVGGSLVNDFIPIPGEQKIIQTLYEETPPLLKAFYWLASFLSVVLAFVYYQHRQKTAWTKGIDLTASLKIDKKVAEEVRQKSRLATDEIVGYVQDVKNKTLMALVTPKYDLVLGRNNNVNVVFKSDSVSGEHAELGWDKEKQQFWLQDNDSTNGTWWGKGKQLEAGKRYPLESGKLFYLADQETPVVVIAHADDD